MHSFKLFLVTGANRVLRDSLARKTLNTPKLIIDDLYNAFVSPNTNETVVVYDCKDLMTSYNSHRVISKDEQSMVARISQFRKYGEWKRKGGFSALKPFVTEVFDFSAIQQRIVAQQQRVFLGQLAVCLGDMPAQTYIDYIGKARMPENAYLTEQSSEQEKTTLVRGLLLSLDFFLAELEMDKRLNLPGATVRRDVRLSETGEPHNIYIYLLETDEDSEDFVRDKQQMCSFLSKYNARFNANPNLSYVDYSGSFPQVLPRDNSHYIEISPQELGLAIARHFKFDLSFLPMVTEIEVSRSSQAKSFLKVR